MMRKATNREELAEVSLGIANEALNALDMAIRSQDCSIRDLNSIVSTCSKIYREIRTEVQAEAKKLADVEEDQKEQEFGDAISQLLVEISETGK